MKILLACCWAMLSFAFMQMPADPPMKMGLWEITTTTTMQMPDMPAGMPGMGLRTNKLHACVTKESYQKTFAPTGPQAKDCTISNQTWTGKTMSMDISCNAGKMTGHVESTFDSATAGHSKTHMEMNGGRSIQIDSSATTTFLSADCGPITPDKPQIIK